MTLITDDCTKVRTAAERREWNRKVLGECNALVRWNGRNTWMAARETDGALYNHSGTVMAVAPAETRQATLDEILDYYETEMAIAVSNFGRQAA